MKTPSAKAGSVQRLVSLRIRSLIANKEMATAQANHDLARFGEWRCDYAAWHGQIDAEIEKLLAQANATKLNDGPAPGSATEAGQ